MTGPAHPVAARKLVLVYVYIRKNISQGYCHGSKWIRRGSGCTCSGSEARMSRWIGYYHKLSLAVDQRHQNNSGVVSWWIGDVVVTEDWVTHSS